MILMKGAFVFLAVFAIVVVVSLGYVDLPPGRQIYDAIGGVDVDYPILGISVSTLVPACFNGIVYGIIAWIIYSGTLGRKTEKVHVPVEVKPQEGEVKSREAQTPTITPVEEKPMTVSLSSLEGIGSIFAEKLAALGIKTSGDLLEAGKTSQKRATISEKAGISIKLILKWVNLADLIRIKGVSEEYSDLLEVAGVDTVPELARRNPENLYAKLREVNEEKELVRRLPSISMVTEWIEQAKKLPRILEY